MIKGLKIKNVGKTIKHLKSFFEKQDAEENYSIKIILYPNVFANHVITNPSTESISKISADEFEVNKSVFESISVSQITI